MNPVFDPYSQSVNRSYNHTGGFFAKRATRPFFAPFLNRAIDSSIHYMIITTTPTLEGKRITRYIGLVNGEAIIGANLVKDFFAGISDIVGGRSGAYEQGLREAKSIAIKDMMDQAHRLGANAIVGVDLDYQTIGGNGSMLMVSANGTAVIIE